MNDHLAYCLELCWLLTDNGVWGIAPRAARLPHVWVVEAVDGAQLRADPYGCRLARVYLIHEYACKYTLGSVCMIRFLQDNAGRRVLT